MPVVRDTAIPLRNYSGFNEIGPLNVPDFVRYLQFEIARCTSVDLSIWTSALTLLAMRFEVSIDGGEWRPAGGFDGAGGISRDRQGNEVTKSLFKVDVPPGVNRRIRATVDISNGPLRTTGTMEVGS